MAAALSASPSTKESSALRSCDWQSCASRAMSWMGRSGASSAVLDEARRRLREAPERIRRYLRVKPDGDDLRFHLPRVVLVAKRVD